MKTDKCPTCNAPVKTTWSGLDLVAESGDETLASKHYEYQPNGNNTLLAVSGLIQKVEGIKHWIQKCGVDNAIRGSVMIDLLDDVLAACASGAVDKTVSDGLKDCKHGHAYVRCDCKGDCEF